MDLYYVPSSPQCRAVLLTINSLEIQVNLINVEQFEGTKYEEFIQLNPRNDVPLLVDNGFVLWESRAIMTYLANKYSEEDTIYPSDPKKRANVDKMLYFDMGTLYQKYLDCYFPAYSKNCPIKPNKMKQVDDAFKIFNDILKDNIYAAGNQLTIADLALIATISTYMVSGYNIDSHPYISAWFNLVTENAPGYEEANGKNVLLYRTIIENIFLKREKSKKKKDVEKQNCKTNNKIKN